MKYEIKNRSTGRTQFTAEIDCDEDASLGVKVGLSVKWAIGNKAELRGANLWEANLWEADLTGADLRGANLWEANLRGADLRGANLWGANLQGANLREVDLRGANLQGAHLQEAHLQEADGVIRLSGALDYGYERFAYMYDGVIRIKAGCRDFTYKEAKEHWGKNSKATNAKEKLEAAKCLYKLAKLTFGKDAK